MFPRWESLLSPHTSNQTPINVRKVLNTHFLNNFPKSPTTLLLPTYFPFHFKNYHHQNFSKHPKPISSTFIFFLCIFIFILTFIFLNISVQSPPTPRPPPSPQSASATTLQPRPTTTPFECRRDLVRT